MAAVTMMDIARKAKVSRPTVSLILNGRETQVRISESTRQRVLDVSKSLGYRRNEIARSMVTGKSNFIGFTGDISHEYCSMMLKGIVEKAEFRKYYVKIFSDPDPDKFETNVNTIIEQRPAGIIFRSLSKKNYEFISRECRLYEIPFAIAGSSFPGNCGIRVSTADDKGAAMAVKHLIKLGHKRIAHISGDRISGYVELRRAGFLAQMKKMQLDVPENYFIHSDKIEVIEKSAVDLLSTKNRPTAIFCASDHFAMVVIRAARRVGLSVPEDISVIGFANMNLSKLADPPLTTIAEPFIELGQTVADELINEIEKDDKISLSKQIEKELDVKLIIRDSTGPVKKED